MERVNNSIIEFLEEEFGETWTIIKKGNFINDRAIMLTIFFLIISKSNFIKPLYSSIKQFYNKYKDDSDFINAVLETEVKNPYDPFDFILDSDDNSIFTKYSEYIEKYHSFNDCFFDKINIILPKVIALAKKNNSILESYVNVGFNSNINYARTNLIPIDIYQKEIDEITLEPGINSDTVKKLFHIANATWICKNFINTESNFGLIFSISTKMIEGINSFYKTGGDPTRQTIIREKIVREIIGHVKKPRKTGRSVPYKKYIYSSPVYKKRYNTNSKKRKYGSTKNMVWIYNDGSVTNLKNEPIFKKMRIEDKNDDENEDEEVDISDDNDFSEHLVINQYQVRDVDIEAACKLIEFSKSETILSNQELLTIFED